MVNSRNITFRIVQLRIGISILSLLMFFACNDSNSITPPTDSSSNNNSDDLSTTDYNVLFIGNSLTYTNNLPQLVKEKALAKGINVGVKSISSPNYAIIDHWLEGRVQNQIESKLFDYVIIQQGPSSQAFGREVLIEYGKKFSDLCIENDAELCFFMVWPSLTYYDTFNGVIKNYTDAARMYDAILCPVGSVWKQYFDDTGDFSYYGGDGFHPSLSGSKVAADVIVQSIFR